MKATTLTPFVRELTAPEDACAKVIANLQQSREALYVDSYRNTATRREVRQNQNNSASMSSELFNF
jgi:hypothetical protein